MKIRVAFEIGHSARTAAKPQINRTHDWELFVRSGDNSNISRYIDRIVFTLHETFPNPVRGN